MNGSTKLEVEFHASNKKFFKLFHNIFEYQGRTRLTHFGETFEHMSVHQFKVSFHNPNASSFDDLYKIYNSSEYQLPTKIIKCPPINERVVQLPVVYTPKGLSDQTLVVKQEFFTKNQYDFLNQYFFSMQPEKFALRTTNQTVSIQNPQSFNGVINKLESLIGQSPNDKRSLTFIIRSQKIHDAIENVLPDFTYLGEASEPLWISIVRIKMKNPQGKAVVKYIDRGNFPTAKITIDKKSCVVKERESGELVNSLIGYKFLKSLNLKNLLIPEPVVFGKYYHFNYRYFNIETEIPGNTMGHMMFEIGDLPLNSPKRIALRNEAVPACRQSGKCLAELQNKGSIYKRKPSPELIDEWIDKLEQLVKEIIEEVPLSIRNKIRTITKSPEVQKRIKVFKKDPGELLNGFDDIHANNLSTPRKPLL